MNDTNWLNNSATLSSPPPGSVNVLIGDKVEGPGGKWIPCATKTADGAYISSLFQVGPGKRQVCAANIHLRCPKEALLRATELAFSAAA